MSLKESINGQIEDKKLDNLPIFGNLNRLFCLAREEVFRLYQHFKRMWNESGN